jgi:hypothetical protein
MNNKWYKYKIHKIGIHLFKLNSEDKISSRDLGETEYFSYHLWMSSKSLSSSMMYVIYPSNYNLGYNTRPY